MSGIYEVRKTQYLSDVDINDWDHVSPYQVLRNPHLFWYKSIAKVGAKALKYARAEESDLFDEIGSRGYAASPGKGQQPLQTVASIRLENSKKKRQIKPEHENIIEEHEKLTSST